MVKNKSNFSLKLKFDKKLKYKNILNILTKLLTMEANRFDVLNEENERKILKKSKTKDKNNRSIDTQEKKKCTFEQSYYLNGQKMYKNCLDSDCHMKKIHYFNKRYIKLDDGRKVLEEIDDCPLNNDCWMFHKKNNKGKRKCTLKHPLTRMKSPCSGGNKCKSWRCGLKHSHPIPTCAVGENCYFADHSNKEYTCMKRHPRKLKPLCKDYMDCMIFDCDSICRHHPFAPYPCKDGLNCQIEECPDKHPKV